MTAGLLRQKFPDMKNTNKLSGGLHGKTAAVGLNGITTIEKIIEVKYKDLETNSISTASLTLIDAGKLGISSSKGSLSISDGAT